MDRNEIVEKLIDDFNNFEHLSLKTSKKVVEILIDKSNPKVDDN